MSKEKKINKSISISPKLLSKSEKFRKKKKMKSFSKFVTLAIENEIKYSENE